MFTYFPICLISASRSRCQYAVYAHSARDNISCIYIYKSYIYIYNFFFLYIRKFFFFYPFISGTLTVPVDPSMFMMQYTTFHIYMYVIALFFPLSSFIRGTLTVSVGRLRAVKCSIFKKRPIFKRSILKKRPILAVFWKRVLYLKGRLRAVQCSRRLAICQHTATHCNTLQHMRWDVLACWSCDL